MLFGVQSQSQAILSVSGSIELIGSSQDQIGAAGDLTLSFPAGLAEGDLIIFFTLRAANSSNDIIPEGYLPLFFYYTDGTTRGAYKFADAQDVVDGGITISMPERAVGTVVVVRGADEPGIGRVLVGDDVGTSTTSTAESTETNASDLIFAHFSINGNARNVTSIPTDMTEVEEVGENTGQGMLTYSQNPVGASVSGDKSIVVDVPWTDARLSVIVKVPEEGSPYNTFKYMERDAGGVDQFVSSNLADFHWRPGGNKFFVTADALDRMARGSASTPFRARFSSGNDQQTSFPANNRGIWWKPDDGAAVFYLTPTSLLKMTGGNAWDVYSKSTAQTLDLSADISAAESIWISNDGTLILIADGNDNTAHKYDLSSAWDLSTASHSQSVDLSADVSQLRAVQRSDDGATLYALCSTNLEVYSYPLTSNDLSSLGTVTVELDVSGQMATPYGMRVADDEKDLWVFERGNSDRLYQYRRM